MGIEHHTTVTCDRCKTETRYDTYSDRGWQTDWASLWPATIAPCGERPPISGSENIICNSCLTDAEREQLAETRHRLQYNETYPF